MQHEEAAVPGIVISALRGGAGKTILSIGVVAAWRLAGRHIAPFKKGPDYIDAGWLALAAQQPCYNLDTFLTPDIYVTASFQKHSINADMAVVEGNRGLYDGIDIDGRTSTAEIAKLLGLPVVLCVDCTKTTRTMAAVLAGCRLFDGNVQIKGVVLNRVAGARHESILRRSIEHHCGITVIGALPKLRRQDFPERHMGLVPTPEHEWANDSINAVADIARQYVDLDHLAEIAATASPVQNTDAREQITDKQQDADMQIAAADLRFPKPFIGVIRDSAFQFYYPDNLEALEAAGASLVFTSPLKEDNLPDVDALYIGGGFPETHAEALSANTAYREAIREKAMQGLPIYAECGGLMYLGERLVIEKRDYPMTAILPIVFGLSKKPQGHGYTVSTVDTPNPYFPVGTEIRGHEFRYSTVDEWRGKDADMVFATQRGTGFKNKRDGICYKNVLASYTHLHAAGTPGWAHALVRQARAFQQSRKQ